MTSGNTPHGAASAVHTISPFPSEADVVQPAMAGIPLPKPPAAMTLRERIWTTFEDPTSSALALVVAGVVVGTIIVSVITFLLQTLPQFVVSGEAAFGVVEDVCIAIFTIEFVLRIACCPSLYKFVTTPLNIIDFVAIAPFYVELFVGGTGGSGATAIIRVLRLIRIFRIFKVARYLPWLRVFAAALALSVQPLLMLVLVLMIGVIVFASAIYYAERGEWSDETQAYMRNVDGTLTPSPFSSIPASMWWAIITMTTVGYGDVVPVTPPGKLIATMAAVAGILVIAIPITIISTNFNGEYAKMNKEKDRVRARMMLLRNHFAARKAGLDAVLDEVADLVRRNTQEFENEVETLFDQARNELTEEIQEIVRMAFERRRQLHLAALTAGRVQGSLATPQQDDEDSDDDAPHVVEEKTARRIFESAKSQAPAPGGTRQ